VLKLAIGNKCYSSWSLRPWMVLKQFGIPFEEVMIPFSDPIDTPEWKGEVAKYTPAGRVPALVDDRLSVWDSLAIIEYLADKNPELAIWPRDPSARAIARSISAEMHSGFQGLRNACPMNLGNLYDYRDRGEGVAKDVARITSIWRDMRVFFGANKTAPGPFLFGAFSAADAMYAPVVARFEGYSLPVDKVMRDYMDAVLQTPAFAEWRTAALKETAIVPVDEVDETPIAVYRKTR
jgi:glutathione S-transferase